ncbi:MAG: hypothetical protein R2867_30015 [Caldilineaceae bacterium]
MPDLRSWSRHANLQRRRKILRVSAELAAAFQPGDALAAVGESEQLLHIPAAERKLATAAIALPSMPLPRWARCVTT